MMERLKAAAATVDSCTGHWTLVEIMRNVSESHSQTASSVIGRQHIPNMGQVLLLHRGGKRHILAFWVLHTNKEKWEVVKWAQKKLDMLGVWCPQYDPGHMPGLVTARCWAGLGWAGLAMVRGKKQQRHITIHCPVSTLCCMLCILIAGAKHYTT